MATTPDLRPFCRSLRMKNYFNYFTEVEEYFLKRRGTYLLVSPLDWCLIELWKENEIPLSVVLRGIDRSFERIEKAGKRPPRSLSYCHPAIVEAFEEYRQAMVGASQSEAGTPSGSQLPVEGLGGHLQHLEDSLKEHDGEPFARARSQLADLAFEVESRGELDYEQLDRDLNRIASLVVDALMASMEVAELKELRAQSRKDLKIYKRHLSPEMYRQLEAGYLARKTRERPGLPEFGILESVSVESG